MGTEEKASERMFGSGFGAVPSFRGVISMEDIDRKSSKLQVLSVKEGRMYCTMDTHTHTHSLTHTHSVSLKHCLLLPVTSLVLKQQRHTTVSDLEDMSCVFLICPFLCSLPLSHPSSTSPTPPLPVYLSISLFSPSPA